MDGNGPPLARRFTETDSIRRRVRLVVLLDAAENAGLAPLRINRLHAFAYLINVLAPVWDMPALEGKLLKRRAGPFYPDLQADLDRLVGMGMVTISGLSHELDVDGRWRLEGFYRLNQAFSQRVLSLLRAFEEDRRSIMLAQELAYALCALRDEEIDLAFTEDATYSDPLIGIGEVVDFAEWQTRNYSANAARSFSDLLPSGASATPGEKLHLFVRHIHRRLNSGA